MYINKEVDELAPDDKRGQKVMGFLRHDDITRPIRSSEGMASLFCEVRLTGMKERHGGYSCV